MKARNRRGFAKIADDPLYPPDLRALVWCEWERDPATRARIDAEIAALLPGDPQVALYRGGPVTIAERDEWLAAAPLAAPLRAFCAATCPSTARSCARAAFALVGGTALGLSVAGTPVGDADPARGLGLEPARHRRHPQARAGEGPDVRRAGRPRRPLRPLGAGRRGGALPPLMRRLDHAAVPATMAARRVGVALRALLALVGLLSVILGATVVRAADLPGQDAPRFQAALELWLADDEETALPEFAALAAEGNRAAQVLLARIDATPTLQGPWLQALPRAERNALMRAPGGLSGRSWMQAAAEDTPLAQLWLVQPTPEATGETALAFAALGEARAARDTLYALPGDSIAASPPSPTTPTSRPSCAT